VSTFRRLLRLSLPYSGQMLLAIILGIGTVAAGAGLLSTSAYLIARAALQPSIADLQVAIVAVRAFGLARGGLRYVERLTTHSAAFHTLSRLRLWFYDRLEPLVPAALSQVHSGDLLARITDDIETLDDFFVRALAPLGVALGSAVAGGLFMAQFDPGLGLELAGAFLLGGMIVPSITFTAGRRTGPKLIALRAQLKVVELDLLQGMPDLLLAGAVERQQVRLAELEDELATQQRRETLWRGFAEAVPALLGELTVLVFILTLTPQIRAGSLAGIMLPTLLLAAIAAFEAIAPLPDTFQRLGKQLAAARRLFDLADRPIPVRAPNAPASVPDRFDLRFNSLTFAYGSGEQPALSRVSFHLPQDASLGLVGPSGGGKSTLINLLTRFWPYTTGQIEMGGVELRTLDPTDLLACMSVISQQTDFFAGTLQENLLLAQPRASEGEIWHALEQAGLADWVAGLPSGLETLVGERGLMLSGGERQRVAIARAFLQTAPILILDEFDAHLDLSTRTALLARVKELMMNRTTLIATHRLPGWENLDQFIILEGGRITASGTHRQLLESSPWYAAAYAAQMQERILEELRTDPASPSPLT
jgi:thiol reductant ABC exporter CydC subunit